jgi:hypothetical protein
MSGTPSFLTYPTVAIAIGVFLSEKKGVWGARENAEASSLCLKRAGACPHDLDLCQKNGILFQNQLSLQESQSQKKSRKKICNHA